VILVASLHIASERAMSDTHSVQGDEQQLEQRLRTYILAQHRSRLDAHGTVTGKDVCQILEALGLPFEEGEVKPLLPDWGNVSTEAAVEAVTTVRITHNAELDHMIQRMEEGIIRLSLWEYLMYKLPFTKKDPAWQHRAIEFSLDLAPRQVLFISTGVVLLVAGMSILLLMSLLWLGQARGREEVQLQNFQLLLHSFAESFEQRFLDVHAATMVDEADTLAKMIERQFQLYRDTLNEEFSQEVVLLAAVVNSAASVSWRSVVDPQVSLLNTLRGAFVPPSDTGVTPATLSEIVAAVMSLNSAATDDADAPWETFVVTHFTASGAVAEIALAAPVATCSYGTCDYRSVPCIADSVGSSPPSASEARFQEVSADVRRLEVSAVYTRLNNIATANGSTVHVTICSTLPVEYRERAQRAGVVLAVAQMNEELHAPLATRREIVAAYAPNASSPTVMFLTPLLRIPAPCHFTQSCTGLDGLTQQALAAQEPRASEVLGYTGTQLLAAAAPTTVSNVAVLMVVSVEGIVDEQRDQLVSVANRMNIKSGIELEVSIGRRDPVTGSIKPQLTDFRYAGQCLRPCERRDASSIAARTAIETQSAGYVIAPNYQPVAVLASYSFVTGALGVSIVVERDVASIRAVAMASLVAIFEANNAAFDGSLEAQLVAYEGFVPTRTYDPAARCDQIRDCERSDAIGVVYRSDCAHCSREPTAVALRRVRCLTPLKFQEDCDRKRNCSAAAIANDDGLWRRVLVEQNSLPRLISGAKDYRDQPVLAVTSYVANLSIGIVVKIDKDETEGPILTRIGIASGVALGVVIVGLWVLIFFSRKVLDRIEHEWLTYKDQIDAEKKKFDAMVQDVLPAHVSSELRNTHKLAMSVPSMSFVFLDVVGMSDRTRSWSPELVCRYVTYIFTVIDRACTHYSLNKVRVFGDTYFAVGGLGESATEQHCVFRTASFGSVVVQLFGPRYAHFPDRVPLIRETFEDFVAKNGAAFPDVQDNPDDVGHIAMPPMRVGMHSGIGTFCIIETGRTPAYEVFGPGVALAARMQSTSISNRIHMSGAMKETLERLDKERLFDFDPMRKTVVKGQGTIHSFFVRSANVVVPPEVLQHLGIEYANRRVYYEEGAVAAGAPAGST
jgi:class 3 adenylate cyclase